MKVNAPEKIYIQSFNVREEDAKFDKSKMFFDDVWTEEPESGQENIEYTRTDALIEKAVEYINEHVECYMKKDKMCNIPLCPLFAKQIFIENFKTYMKGE